MTIPHQRLCLKFDFGKSLIHQVVNGLDENTAQGN